MPRTVDTYLHLPRRRYFSALEWHGVAIGSIAAAVLLIGYGFNFAPMQNLIPGFPTMKPRTAAVLMTLSVAYLMSLRESRRAKWGSTFLAAGCLIWVVIIHFNWVADFLTGPWAISPSEATLFCLGSASLTLLIINLAPRFGLLAGIIAVVAATPAMFRVFGLLLFWDAPDKDSPLDTMALHTAILIVWFLMVCVMLHPRLGFARAVLQASLRGRLLRRALPPAVAFPVIAAAASLVLSGMFGWPNEALFAATATISVTLGALLIWWLSSLVENWQIEANEQASRLSRANEALEQYASAAAHDLKAPARHVLLYGELLQEALRKGDSAAAQKHAKSIHASAAEMPGMIDGLLHYSRSAFTRIRLSDTYLSELVQAAAAPHAQELATVGARVVVVNEARLRCDSTLMTSVFQNLIANAIASRRKDKPLVIHIDAIRADDVITLSVEDNGVGFDPDFAAVAFNPLARGVHTAGEGSGIGLSTCRSIVQSHGGEIRIDPAYRSGARIQFTLPDPGKASDAGKPDSEPQG